MRPIPHSEKIAYKGAMLTGEIVKEIENNRTYRPMIVKLSEESKKVLASSSPTGIPSDGSIEVISAVRGWGMDPLDNPRFNISYVAEVKLPKGQAKAQKVFSGEVTA